jgi:hypothetical protein
MSEPLPAYTERRKARIKEKDVSVLWLCILKFLTGFRGWSQFL